MNKTPTASNPQAGAERDKQLAITKQFIQFIVTMTEDNPEGIWQYVTAVNSEMVYTKIRNYFYYEHPSTKAK